MALAVEQKTGVTAILAILASIGSYVASCAGSPIIGLLLAILGIGLGGVGLAMSASPRVGGGLISVVAIALGVLAIIFSILAMIGVLVF